MRRVIPLVLGLLLVISSTAPYVNAISAAGTVFTPLSAIWGTSASPVEAAPGSQNVLLTVSIAYTGGLQATSLLGTLRLPAGITDVNGNTAPTAGTVSVNPDSIFQLSYNLNIGNDVATGTYTVPIVLAYTTTAGGSYSIYSETDNTVVNILGTVTLNFASSQSSLRPGQVNNIQVTLSNTGSGTATHITTSVSTSANTGSGVTVQTSSSGSSVSILNVPPAIASLNAGSSMPFNVSVYVPESAAGSSIALYFSSTYTDPYGLSKTLTQGVGLYASSAITPILNFGTTTESLVPGQINTIPVTLTNLGPGSISRVHTTITASSQFSVLSQFPQIQNLAQNSSVSASLRTYVLSSQAGSSVTLTFSVTYTDALGASQSSTQTLDLYVDTISQPILYFQALQQSVSPGGISTVPIIFTNLGSVDVTGLLVTASVPSQSGSVLKQLPTMAKLASGSQVNGSLQIYVPASAAGSSLPLTLTTSYYDKYGSAQTSSQTLYLYVTNLTNLSSASVSVTTINSTIRVGKSSPVAFSIRNSGSSSLYSPTFSLTVSTPLVVTNNSVYSPPGVVIDPGKAEVYTATISTSPSSTLGVYSATLQVSYQDQSGNQRTQDFPVGLVLVGRIALIVQSPQITQDASSITVSGTLLNEGFSPAYYVSVTGTLGKSSGTPYYAGEVDPNTPIPFTVKIPYIAPNSSTRAPANSSTRAPANIQLSISYKDSFGTPAEYATSVPAALKSANQLAQGQGLASTQTSSGQTLTNSLLTYGIIGAILIVAVASVFALRRRRGNASRKKNEAEVDEKVV